MMTKGKLTRSDIGEILYLVYFVLMIGARAFGLYEGQTATNAILVISMLLFAAHMIVTPHTLREYIVAAVLLIIAGVVYLHTGEKGLLICFTMLLGMKGVSVMKVVVSGAVTAGACIVFRIFTGVFGLLPELFYPQVRDGVGEMFRHSLGYAHPNTLHMNVLLLTFLVVFAVTYRTETMDTDEAVTKRIAPVITASVLMFALNLYVFMYSGSRTGLLVSLVYLCVNMWFYLRPTPGIFERIVCLAAYPIAVFLALALPFVLPESLFDRVNISVFNTRLSIARYFWSNNHISLWGIRLNNPDPIFERYGLDMAHLYLFLQLGIVAFTVISILTVMYVIYALKEGESARLAVLMAVLFAGIWEPFLYNSSFKNITFVFFGAALYGYMKRYSAGNKAVSEPDSKAITLPDDNEASSQATKATTVPVHKTLSGHFTPAVIVAIAALVGLISSVVYLAATEPPRALYTDTQTDEAGTPLGLTPLYLTQEDVTELRSDGNLVVRYVDQDTPMYEYGTDAAVSEYHKQAVSIGVWCGFAAACICLIIRSKYVRNMRILFKKKI